jgi:hypothetical protein
VKRVLAILAAAGLLAIVPSTVSGVADEVFTGTFAGTAEMPPVTTGAGGTAYVFINPGATEIKYAVSYAGLSGRLVAVHINAGAAGVTGPIMLTLAAGPSTMFGTLTPASFHTTTAAPTWAAALALIRGGKAYVNLHTVAHPDGEVRAQLKAAPAAAATTAPTHTPTAVPAPTASPVATARATARRTTAPVHRSLPPTTTDPATGRGSTTDLLPLLILLGIATLGGLIATIKVRPGAAPPEE